MPRSGGLLLGAYRAATTLFGLVSPLYLRRRLRRGKEDRARLGERMGHAGLPRPPGRLVWLHGASVGEGLALLPLVDRLTQVPVTVLVTTGTVSSARILAGRLPAGALHQFVPLDVPAPVRRFLSHWQPDLCLLAESELWPNLIAETTRRGIPLVLVNARLSQRSFDRWRRLPRFIGPLLARIDLCLAQDDGDAGRFARLGAPHVAVAGNLKFDAPAPPADEATLKALATAIGARPVWLAASIHPHEEAAVLDVHRSLAASQPDLLTIALPRHAERGGPIAEQAAARGLTLARRSHGEAVGAGTAVYLADTMGETGLFYRLTRLVFVGKSLAGHNGGGQNPIEPARLGCGVLHGPAVANFTAVYRLLDAAGGARPVADARDLADQLAILLTDKPRREALADAAYAAVAAEGGAADRIMRAIAPYLAAHRPATKTG